MAEVWSDHLHVSPEGLLALIGVAGALLTGLFAVWNRRAGERARRVPSWGELSDDNQALREENTALRTELRTALADLCRATNHGDSGGIASGSEGGEP